jgi:hypothetical protein
VTWIFFSLVQKEKERGLTHPKTGRKGRSPKSFGEWRVRNLKKTREIK